MNAYIALIIGFLIGCVVARVFLKPKHAGTLQVYHPNELGESESLFLDLDVPVRAVSEKTYVIFKVRNLHT